MHAGVGPGVTGVPPAHQQVGVFAEYGWVAGGDDNVVGFRFAVDGVVHVGGLGLGELHLDANV